eukprot:scaffold46791_cov14-Tisochrysis_lutea.AAC.1
MHFEVMLSMVGRVQAREWLSLEGETSSKNCTRARARVSVCEGCGCFLKARQDVKRAASACKQASKQAVADIDTAAHEDAQCEQGRPFAACQIKYASKRMI